MKMPATLIETISNDLGNPEGLFLQYIERFLSLIFKTFLFLSIPVLMYIISIFLALH